MKPFTKTHKAYMDSMHSPYSPITIAVGHAGTGKTHIACTTAIKQLSTKMVDKVIITRPTKNVDEELGYLPGDIGNKMSPYMRPIYDCFLETVNKKQLKKYFDTDCIEICPIAYMRGRTFHNAFIIADECQNTSINQMRMLLTRIGYDSKMVITGDTSQSDMIGTNGLSDLLVRCEKLYENKDECLINIIKFDENDMLRNDIVTGIIEMYNI